MQTLLSSSITSDDADSSLDEPSAGRRRARRSVVGGFQFVEKGDDLEAGGARDGADGYQRRHRASVFEQSQKNLRAVIPRLVEREDSSEEAASVANVGLTLQHLDSRRQAFDSSVRGTIDALKADPKLLDRLLDPTDGDEPHRAPLTRSLSRSLSGRLSGSGRCNLSRPVSRSRGNSADEAAPAVRGGRMLKMLSMRKATQGHPAQVHPATPPPVSSTHAEGKFHAGSLPGSRSNSSRGLFLQPSGSSARSSRSDSPPSKSPSSSRADTAHASATAHPPTHACSGALSRTGSLSRAHNLVAPLGRSVSCRQQPILSVHRPPSIDERSKPALMQLAGTSGRLITTSTCAAPSRNAPILASGRPTRDAPMPPRSGQVAPSDGQARMQARSRDHGY